MKILRLYTKIPPVSGGMENHIYNLTIEQNRKHVVVVVFNEGEKISDSDIKIEGINYSRFRPQSLGMILFYLNVLKKMFFLKDNKFDVIHIHGDWSSLLFVQMLKKITKAKVVAFTIHGKLSEGKLYKTVMRFLLQKVDCIFSTGFETGNKLIEISNEEKVTIQPSGVNKIFFEDRDYKSIQDNILTVANINEKKNVEFIITLAKNNPKLNFTIVGSGNLENKIKRIVKNEAINNFVLVGNKTREEVKKILDMSTCFLLTSIEEGTPTAILEAMSRGLPIITSNVGGISNIVKDGHNGFVINDFSVLLFSEKLNLLNCRDDMRLKMSKTNIQESVEFEWNIVANRITTIIEKKYNESITCHK